MSADGRIGLDRYEYVNKQRLAVQSSNQLSANKLGYISDSRISHQQMNVDFSINAQNNWLGDDLFTNFVLGTQSIWVDRTSNFAEASNTVPFFDMVNAGATRDAGSSLTKTQTVGIFGQLTTTYLDRLSLTLAVRRDGSSTFSEDQQFFLYPKVGFSYTLSKEPFMESTKSLLSNIRFRGSWGQAGSPSLPGAYATNFLYGTAGFFDPWGRTTTASRSNFMGIKQGGGQNAEDFIVAGALNINPELTSEIEAGIDLGFFENKLNLEITYYNQSITDMILNVPVPTSTGFDQQLRNAGEMWNKGIEIT